MSSSEECWWKPLTLCSMSSSACSKSTCSRFISSCCPLRSFTICASTSPTLSSMRLGHPYASHLSPNCSSESWKLKRSSTSNCKSMSSSISRTSSVSFGISVMSSSSSATSSMLVGVILRRSKVVANLTTTSLLLLAAFSAMIDMIIRISASYFWISEELIASSLMLNIPRLMNCGTSSATFCFSRSFSSISRSSSCSVPSRSSYDRTYSVRSMFMNSRYASYCRMYSRRGRHAFCKSSSIDARIATIIALSSVTLFMYFCFPRNSRRSTWEAIWGTSWSMLSAASKSTTGSASNLSTGVEYSKAPSTGPNSSVKSGARSVISGLKGWVYVMETFLVPRTSTS
mmetsp:Transcript_55671/g.132831  ORF Transcript_55671/g.132831 Transcript_55671/m.132831 type:complete len:343 (-) Transcript_55671:1132-2160(-)